MADTVATTEEKHDRSEKNSLMRGSANRTITMDGSASAKTPIIEMEGFSGALIHLPSGLTATDVYINAVDKNGVDKRMKKTDYSGDDLKIATATTGDFSIWVPEVMACHRFLIEFSVAQSSKVIEVDLKV